MIGSPGWRLGSAGALALAAAILSPMAIAGLSGVRTPIGFAEGHDKRAYSLLLASSKPSTLDLAAQEARAALQLSPYNNSARLRLTYIDTLRRGSLGPDGLAHLARSYDLIPYDHTVAAWRVRFALEHWRELTPEVRRAVEAEALAFSRANSRDANVRSVLTSVQDREGRLAAALWLRALAR